MIVSASILSADLCRLGEDISRVKAAGCEHLHFDVMDGVFVPNISYGIPVLESVRKNTDMFVDVHLMITEPARLIPAFAKAGADNITFHAEAASDVRAAVALVREHGKRCGIAIKPGTPVSEIKDVIPLADMVLVMTVEPGFGGQGFIYETLDKIREVRSIAEEKGLDLRIQVDGGINARTAPLVKEAGADVLVTGSYLFGAEDMKSAADALR
ncbi:MAG: ribulose-phosphate 3-epimerase [Oscillospiraceae bacterium]|nr:ribulose-phosphate 3-epimerase [Oscillospiraceae bacterium]